MNDIVMLLFILKICLFGGDSMPDTVHQLLRDSEENYLNTSFWEVHPLFLMVQNGETLLNSIIQITI